jgi:hypothetical protein
VCSKFCPGVLHLFAVKKSHRRARTAPEKDGEGGEGGVSGRFTPFTTFTALGRASWETVARARRM